MEPGHRFGQTTRRIERIDHMTTCDYLLVMKSVRIAELKAKLSDYLRQVRKGHPFTVMDRETPIARVVPYDSGPEILVVRRPSPDAPSLQDVKLPPAIRLRRDPVKLLLEERGSEG